MGWHATLVFMISVVMAFRSRGAARVAWIGMAVWGILNIWLCGRRKMLAMVPIFMGSYLLLLFRFKELRRLVSIFSTVMLIGGFGWYLISSYFYDAGVETFYQSTLTEAEGRLHIHGVDVVVTTLKQAGFWGYGLGMAQQGIHNLPVEKPQLWQESGPGKMMAELGVPGSVLFLGLWTVLLLTLFHAMLLSRSTVRFYVMAGLFSVLIANMTSALVSAQIFGDPLVLFLLAFLAGLLLSGSSPVLQESLRRNEKGKTPAAE